MFKRLLFLLSVIILLTGCRSEPRPTKSETFVTSESTDMAEPNMTEITVTKTEQGGRDEIPVFLRKPEIWGDAPNFMAVRVGGGNFILSSLKGKIVLLNFWSVDCSACKMQIPVLEQLYKKYDREELEIVGVCLEHENIVKRFIKSKNMSYILVLINQEIASKYGRDLRFLPFTLIIDKEGNIIEKYVGVKEIAILDESIKKLLENSGNE